MIYWTKMNDRADISRESEEHALVEGLKRGDAAGARAALRRDLETRERRPG